MSTSSLPDETIPGSKIRSQTIDIAKGIGIILMVIGHVIRGTDNSERISVPEWALTLDMVIYSFHMPLFFLISGLFVPSGVSKKGLLSFWIDKLPTVVYPYFLWASLQALMQIVLAKQVNRVPDWSELSSLPWRPIGQFWFLYTLAQCHLLGGLLAWKATGFRLALIPVVVTLLYLSEKTAVFIPVFWFNFIFFTAGMAIGSRRIDRLPSSIPWLTAALALFGFLNVWTWSVEQHRGQLLQLVVVCSGIWTTFVVCRSLPWHVSNLLARIGEASMAIFVMHVFATAGIRIFLLKTGVSDFVAHLFTGSVAGVMLPMLGWHILKHFSLLPAAGLAPWQRRSQPQPSSEQS